MKASELSKGQTYFALTFADPDMTMPGVEPLVFIGSNLLPEEGVQGETTFAFQDTVSFVMHGPATQTEEECTVFFYRAEMLADLHDLSGIVIEVNRALERAISLGSPRLKKVTGKWT